MRKCHSIGTISGALILLAIYMSSSLAAQERNVTVVVDPAVLSPPVQIQPGIPIPQPRPAWQRRPEAGRTLRVPRDFPTIAAAVVAAAGGDTITIGPGRFRDEIVIDKPLTLIGSGPTETILFGFDKRREGRRERIAWIEPATGSQRVVQCRVLE